MFRDKVYQELGTAKYLHTLEIFGKDARKAKKNKSNKKQGGDDKQQQEAMK